MNSSSADNNNLKHRPSLHAFVLAAYQRGIQLLCAILLAIADWRLQADGTIPLQFAWGPNSLFQRIQGTEARAKS